MTVWGEIIGLGFIASTNLEILVRKVHQSDLYSESPVNSLAVHLYFASTAVSIKVGQNIILFLGSK